MLWERHGHGAYLALALSKYLHDLGPSLAPSNAAQILQGLETLDIRVARHAENTQEVVQFLASHPAVAAVHHPSVPGYPQALLAARDFPRGTGSVFSFGLAADRSEVGAFIDRLRLFKLVANVGDARSLVAHPAAMTHCRLSLGLGTDVDGLRRERQPAWNGPVLRCSGKSAGGWTPPFDRPPQQASPVLLRGTASRLRFAARGVTQATPYRFAGAGYAV